MKYSDSQRVEKIRSMTEKLLSYLRDEQITVGLPQNMGQSRAFTGFRNTSVS